jgi:hypothetical protein
MLMFFLFLNLLFGAKIITCLEKTEGPKMQASVFH